MIGAASELGGRSQPAQSSTTLSTMAPTRPATERIRNPNDALRPHRSIILFVFFCFAVLTTTVCGAPLPRETPSDDLLPQSVQDGFYPYSVGNSTELKEISRQSFYELEGVDVPVEQIGPTLVLYNENRPNKSKDPRKKRPGGKPKKEKIPTKQQALKIVNSPNLKHPQSCEGQFFQQWVKVPGCLTKSIKNKFCHGVCSSYFIPRLRASKLKAFFKSCAFCGPKEYDHIDITLDCPGQDPPQQIRRITKVKKCACLNHDFNL